MTWAAYVQNLEAGKGRCKYAGIYGRNPVSVWAESQDKSEFPISAEDIAGVVRAISSQDMNIMGTGLKIGKLSFTCIRMEQDLLLCQGKGDNNKDHSLVIALSVQTAIVGFNPDAEVKTAFVREAVEVIRDYLKNLGY